MKFRLPSLGPGPNPKHPTFSLLWRGLLLSPIFGLLGLALLFASFAAISAPPIFALTLLIDGHYLLAALLFAAWCWSLRYAKRLLAWLLQGIEHSSL